MIPQKKVMLKFSLHLFNAEKLQKSRLIAHNKSQGKRRRKLQSLCYLGIIILDIHI